MSGSTIGGVVGGVIGFYFGGPQGAQIGWMIGSAVGGYIDPDVIKGPRLKDAQTQTSMEGAPRPIVYGVAVVAGNVIQCGPLVEHKKRERTGKGGPIQETFVYTRSYAIRICEGPVSGIRRVWRDGKLVYDARDPLTPEWGWTADDWRADIERNRSVSQKFLKAATFYLGDEEQLPDPTLEALPSENGGGVGNVPAYRGSAYVVIANEDLTERQGTIPQYTFEVASAGTTVALVGTFRAPRYPAFLNAVMPLDANEEPTNYGYAYIRQDGAAVPTPPNMTGYEPCGSVFEAQTAVAGFYNSGGDQGDFPCDVYLGWHLDDSGLGGAKLNRFLEQPDPADARYLALVYNAFEPVEYRDGWSQSCSLNPEVPGDSPETGWICGDHGDLGRRVSDGTPYIGYPEGGTCLDGTYNQRMEPLRVRVERAAIAPGVPSDGTALPDLPGYYLDADGKLRPIATTLVSGTFKALSKETFGSGAESDTYIRYTLDPVLATGDLNDTEAYWTAAYADAVAAGKLPAGMTYQADGLGDITTYPQRITEAYQENPEYDTLSVSSAALSYVVNDLCSRVGITAAQLDLTQLTDLVRGFLVGRQMPAADAIRSLQQGYFFDFPEWDLNLRGIKRGGPSLFAITDDDLVESDDDEDTRAQAVEFPRKLNLISPDPSQNYESPKETAARRTDNIKAVGEASIELPISQIPDERAQTADKMLRVAWAKAEGRCQFQLPEKFSAMTASDPFTKDSKRWVADRVEYRDGVVKVEASRDRVSAYESSATGTAGQIPTPSPTGILGPTKFTAMNLPRLRSSDNSPGMYLAVCGVTDGWAGADIYLSVDGGVTEQPVATMLDAAIMGTLSAALAADGNTLSVSLYNDDTLESATAAQLAARQNAFAIDVAGVDEVGQFGTATDTGTKSYDLTSLTRGALGTTADAHAAGETFVVLDGPILFLPIDISHQGKTLIYRPVSRGTDPENNATYSFVFDPQFTGPETVTYLLDETGAQLLDEDGGYLMGE